MGAGFGLTGTLLVLTLVVAAILRWNARPAHAIGLAMAAFVTTVAVLSAGAIGPVAADEPAAQPTAVLTAATSETAPSAVPLEISWLVVQGQNVFAAIPWPVDPGATVVLEKVPAPTPVTEAELAAFYAQVPDARREGSTFVVATRAGWPARVAVSGGLVTVAFG